MFIPIFEIKEVFGEFHLNEKVSSDKRISPDGINLRGPTPCLGYRFEIEVVDKLHNEE